MSKIQQSMKRAQAVACEVIEIPSGTRGTLPAGSRYWIFPKTSLSGKPERSKRALKNQPVVRRRWRRLLENSVPQPNDLKGVPKS
jgi:hypothetical protein